MLRSGENRDVKLKRGKGLGESPMGFLGRNGKVVVIRILVNPYSLQVTYLSIASYLSSLKKKMPIKAPAIPCIGPSHNPDFDKSSSGKPETKKLAMRVKETINR